MSRALDAWHRDSLNAISDQSKRNKPRATKPLSELTILIDTREQDPWKFSPMVQTERVTLSDGDYSIKGYSDQIRIERKSLADLCGTITAGRERFKSECARLQNYFRSWLLIEATIEDVEAECYRSRVKGSSVLGTVLSVCCQYKVVPWFAQSHKGAAHWAEWIFRKHMQLFARSEVQELDNSLGGG